MAYFFPNNMLLVKYTEERIFVSYGKEGSTCSRNVGARQKNESLVSSPGVTDKRTLPRSDEARSTLKISRGARAVIHGFPNNVTIFRAPETYNG
jgi:hypothetical protein